MKGMIARNDFNMVKQKFLKPTQHVPKIGHGMG
jgi:hypothetical protein